MSCWSGKPARARHSPYLTFIQKVNRLTCDSDLEKTAPLIFSATVDVERIERASTDQLLSVLCPSACKQANGKTGQILQHSLVSTLGVLQMFLLVKYVKSRALGTFLIPLLVLQLVFVLR